MLFILTLNLNCNSFVCFNRFVFQLSLRVRAAKVYHGIMSTASSVYPHLQLLRNSQAGRLCQTRIKELFLIFLTKMLATKVRKHVYQIRHVLVFLSSLECDLFVLAVKNKLRVPSAKMVKMICMAARLPR